MNIRDCLAIAALVAVLGLPAAVAVAAPTMVDTAVKATTIESSVVKARNGADDAGGDDRGDRGGGGKDDGAGHR